MIHIVYPTIKTENDCEELRYSLRSLDKNLIGDYDITIIGYKPKWITNVKHIPFCESKDKYVNITNKIILALSIYEEISWKEIKYHSCNI